MHDDTISRATALQEIINDPYYIAAWEAVRQDFINGIVQSEAFDVDKRERFKIMLDVMANIQKRIHGHISTGAIEADRKGLVNIFNRKR